MTERLNLKIEKGVPLTPKRRGRELGLVSTTFIEEMNEGDSIVLPFKNAKSLAEYLRRASKDWKAVCRRLPDGNYRVWKMKREVSDD